MSTKPIDLVELLREADRLLEHYEHIYIPFDETWADDVDRRELSDILELRRQINEQLK